MVESIARFTVMAIYWDQARVRYHMAKRGIRNASQLAAFAKVTKPTAKRVLDGDLIDRIDAGILESLAIAFGLGVGSLLIQRPDAQSETSSS